MSHARSAEGDGSAGENCPLGGRVADERSVLLRAQGVERQNQTGPEGWNQGRGQCGEAEGCDGYEGHYGIVGIEAVQLTAEESGGGEGQGQTD